ncbi:MAG: hypothetical protein WC471_03220 [Candidatus Woesearchaeota archaeon]
MNLFIGSAITGFSPGDIWGSWMGCEISIEEFWTAGRPNQPPSCAITGDANAMNRMMTSMLRIVTPFYFTGELSKGVAAIALLYTSSPESLRFFLSVIMRLLKSDFAFSGKDFSL